MTSKITCIIKEVNLNNPNDWNLDLTFKIESITSNTKELTLAAWMGAHPNNVGHEKFEDPVRRYVDLHWD
jgi:hypothetical protein